MLLKGFERPVIGVKEMSWYNPLKWRVLQKRRREVHHELPFFYCGHCGSQIVDDELAFSDITGELYHGDNCAQTASGRINEINNTSIPLNVDYIYRFAAVQLFLKGELKRKPTDDERRMLEERLDG